MMDWLLHSPLPMMVAGVLYLIQAYAYGARGDWGHALTFIAYALGNVGLMMAWRAAS